ncbi:50S ribosomal protein L2 [Candidatus Woesearchaeota archaeon]|nr:MAG: 50S ribosomal protein L2 [Candidatus Woesearchaeota archaeon]
MGKNLIQQARGKGSPRYRAPSFKYRGEAKHPLRSKELVEGTIIDLVHCRGHSAVLAACEYDNGEYRYAIAPEGVRVGDTVQVGSGAELKEGNVLPLGELPEGSLVCNIEGVPGDGGKFVRASGTFARVGSQLKDKVVVILPSKKRKIFHKNCRAMLGIVSGGGRTEKPLLKAGKAHFKAKAKNQLYPVVSGNAQNAVDHPFGNKRSSRKSKATPTSRNAPPGRKVGMIAARITGQKTGRSSGRRPPKGSRGKKKPENKKGKSALGKK